MKTQMTILFLMLLFLLVHSNSYSQQKTVYEKRVEALAIKLYNDLGVPELAKKYKGTGDIGSFIAANKLSERINTEKGMLLMLKYNEDLKKAEILKNTAELKRDKDKKDKEKVEEQKVKEERIRRQKEDDEQKLKNQFLQEYNDSDFAKIREKIKGNFENWLKKSEFEKQEIYQKRIIEKGLEAFDKICSETILNSIKYVTLYLEIGEYNSEEEFFKIKIKKGYSKYEIEDTLKVEISKAEKVEQTNHYISYSTNISNWCYFENELFPKVIEIALGKNKRNKSLITNFNKIKEFDFSTKELGIKNIYFTDLKFDYEKYRIQDSTSVAIIRTKDNLKIYRNNVDYYQSIERASYPDGDDAFIKYFQEKTKSLKLMGSPWKPSGFSINFVVNTDGSISDIEVKQNSNSFNSSIPNPEQKQKIIKIIEDCKKWIPLAQDGKNVRSAASISIFNRQLSLQRL